MTDLSPEQVETLDRAVQRWEDFGGPILDHLRPTVAAMVAQAAAERERALRERTEAGSTLTPAVCTDPACTIPRKSGRPMHGPHDFRAALATPATEET